MSFRSEISKFFNKNIFIVYLIFLIAGLTVSFVIPLLTDLDLNYGPLLLNLFSLTLILNTSTIEAIFIAVATFSLIFWGYIIDKYDRKKYLLLGITITAFGLFIILFDKTNILNYFIGRSLFVGIGLGALGPVAYSYAGDIINFENRSTVSGGISIISIISSGLGIFLSVFLAKLDVFFPFLVIFVLLLIFFVIFSYHSEPLRGREEPEFKKAISGNKISEEGIKVLELKYSDKITFKSLFKLLKRKTNMFMFLQGIFALIPSIIFTYYLISYAHDSRSGGLNFPLEYAMLFAIGPSTGRIFGYLLFGYLGDYFHNKKHTWYERKGKVIVAGITMLLQAPIMVLAFMIVLPVYNNDFSFLENIFKFEFILFGLIFFLGAFIGGGSGPNRRSITYDINEPELRGQASSIFSIGDSFGASIGLLIGSILIIQFNYNFAFQILSVGYLIAGVFWLVALFTIKNDEDELRDNMENRLLLI